MNRLRQWYGIAVILISSATFANQLECIRREEPTLHTLLPRGFYVLLAVFSFMGGLLLVKSADGKDSN